MAKKQQQTETHTEAPKADEPQTEAPKATAPALKLTPVGKITVKTVWGMIDQKKLPALRVNVSDDNPEGDPNPECEVKLCKIVGYATGVKRGEGTYGPWAALTGEFAATNYSTGEVFGGKSAILPGPMGEALVSTTEMALTEDADSKVRFACDVFVKRSARDPQRKYEYVVRPVISAALSSPALELLTLSE